jgi:DNA-binding NarL/FixJ family response regulator
MINLTHKEKEFIRLKADGLKISDIAELLFMSYKSVEKLADDLKKKTNTYNSCNLIHWGYQNGILKINRENPPPEERKAS